MLNYKDIIKLINPVKAHLSIGTTREARHFQDLPFSGEDPDPSSYDIVLEQGQVLQVCPFHPIMDEMYYFRCIPEDKEKFEKKYFCNKEYQDGYYSGFGLSILTTDLENNFEIIEKADLFNLNLCNNGDKFILIDQYIKNPQNENMNILTSELKMKFSETLKQYDEMLITSNEVFNCLLGILIEHYNKD